MLEIYFNEQNDLSDAKRKMNTKFDPTNLMLDTYECSIWIEKEESTDITSKGYEKEKPSWDIINVSTRRWGRGKRRKKNQNPTSEKLLTRLPVLLVQLRTRNNLYKLKKEIKQRLYLFY